MEINMYKNSGNNIRSNISIELIRIVALSLLISGHWSHFSTSWNDYIDIRFFVNLNFSVAFFAIVTGLFVFRNKSLLWKNISRLVFIIIFSVIFSFILLGIVGSSFKMGEIVNFNGFLAKSGAYLSGILLGGRDAWYLYAILPCYFIGPLIYKWLNLQRGLIITILLFMTYIIFTDFIDSEIYNVIYLLFLVFVGYVIKTIFDKYKTRHLGKLKITSLFLSVFGFILIFVLSTQKITDRFLGIIPAMGIVLIALCFPITNTKAITIISFIASNAYFVYEFHWLWQNLWYYIARDFISDYPHLELYVNWVVIIVFSWIVSYGVTYIQKMIWDRFITIPIQLKINVSSNKIIKLIK